MSIQATKLPLVASINSSLLRLIPRATPAIPSITEPAIWPIPEKAVIHNVLESDHLRALLKTINGK